jgi:hypothetical protein
MGDAVDGLLIWFTCNYLPVINSFKIDENSIKEKTFNQIIGSNIGYQIIKHKKSINDS